MRSLNEFSDINYAKIVNSVKISPYSKNNGDGKQKSTTSLTSTSLLFPNVSLSSFFLHFIFFFTFYTLLLAVFCYFHCSVPLRYKSVGPRVKKKKKPLQPITIGAMTSYKQLLALLVLSPTIVS